MLRVTFWNYCRVLKREFRNVEIHRSEADARLRASALNWSILKIEPATRYETTAGDKWA